MVEGRISCGMHTIGMPLARITLDTHTFALLFGYYEV